MAKAHAFAMEAGKNPVSIQPGHLPTSPSPGQGYRPSNVPPSQKGKPGLRGGARVCEW